MSACVLDTDVVIAALDRSDSHHARAVSALSALLEGGVELSMSTINYAEALVRPADDARTLERAIDAIAALGIRTTPPSAAVAQDAARIRALNLSLGDGFALATACAHGASVASFDLRVRRAIEQLDLQLPPQLR